MRDRAGAPPQMRLQGMGSASQQLGESFAVSETGSGRGVEQTVMLACANGSRNLGQQTRLGGDGAGGGDPDKSGRWGATTWNR